MPSDQTQVLAKSLKSCRIADIMTKTVETKEYAIIETGGKQYVVAVGDQLKVEKMSDDVKVGDTIEIATVLLSDNGSEAKIGAPYLSSKVKAKVLDIAKDKKVQVIKYKQKSRYFVKQGHRQTLMKVEILSI